MKPMKTTKPMGGTSSAHAHSPDGVLGIDDVDNTVDVHKRLRELTFLHETSQVLTATLDLESVLRSLMTQVRAYFQVEAASVALLDDETGDLVFRVAVGKAAEAVIGLRLAPDQGVAGSVVQTGQPELVTVAHEDERFYAGIDESTDFYTQTMLAVPIQDGDHSIGVIEALNPRSGSFDDEALRLLPAVADLAAAAIRNAELYQRVRQAEQRYESLFEKSADPIVVLNLDGRIVNANQRVCEILGQNREALIDADFCAVFDVDRQTFDEVIDKVQRGQHHRMKMTLAMPKIALGASALLDRRTLETYMAKIDYGGREAIQWVGHDISERVALEQMREDLTHMIIHDLRNPLGSIMSSIQLVQTAISEEDETLPVMKLLAIAMRSGRKLYRLIDSLLDLARLESGETELQKVLVQPDQLLREAVEQVHPLALNKDQTLEMQIAPNLPGVLADGDMILRVLTNLLDNAVKFVPREGEIRVTVELLNDDLCFSVQDTGPGISPEFRHRIFERFARLGNFKGIKGTGLGLAFCKLAVEAHRGRIWLDSEVGSGSTFYFTLPLGTGNGD
ncbi:MAG TPA: PAS domain S-box protein [Chloroflexi bacterium]|nr:PAS domain S-box protein [Chloroflexota bacterium]